MDFYIGLHQPSDAHHFKRCCIHIGRLLTRRKPLGCPCVLVDSRAFKVLELYGYYPDPPRVYAAQVLRLVELGLAPEIVVVSQDFMCEQYIFQKRYEHVGVRFTVADHQRLTIARYDELRGLLRRDVALMPVLQGYAPDEYVSHIRQYGSRLVSGMWVGVGSVCKRNADPSAVRDVLYLIKKARPDLRLHGFGLKKTALASPVVRSLLWSADSTAWSLNARKNGGNANDWRVAETFARSIEGTDFSDLPLFSKLGR